MGHDSSKSAGGPSKLTSTLGLKSGPSNATVQRHIETAKKSRVLQLKGSGLKKIPDQLQELAEVLRHVDLSNNKLKSIPPSIGNFSSLKQLHLSENVLDSLPDEVGQLKALEVLDVSNNQLTELPSTLAGCYVLKQLNVSNNNILNFPRVLCDLPNLANLDLSKNVIITLPDEISSCHAGEINLNLNRLTSINAAALSKCSRLKILRIEENCLDKKEFTRELLEDSTLAIISYNGNLFQDKEFQNLAGYESYQERYTATKRKM